MSEAKNEIPTDYANFVYWILTAPYWGNDNTPHGANERERNMNETKHTAGKIFQKPVMVKTDGGWKVSDGVNNGYSSSPEGAHEAYKSAKAESNAFRPKFHCSMCAKRFDRRDSPATIRAESYEHPELEGELVCESCDSEIEEENAAIYGREERAEQRGYLGR